MMTKVISQLKQFKEILGIFIFILTFFSGAVAFGWCKFAVPEIDKRIDDKQSPVITELKSINRSLEFQTFVQMRNLSQPRYDSIMSEYQRYFPKRSEGGTE